MSTSWESILLSGSEDDIKAIPEKVMTICTVIAPAIKLSIVAMPSSLKNNLWSVEIQGIGRNPVGLIDVATEEIAALLFPVKEQEIINYTKRSALFYLSYLVSKLGIATNWVKFSDSTGESMVVCLKDGEYISSKYSNDENPNGFEYVALELLRNYGLSSQYLDEYFELFYENNPVYSWLLMEKKEIFDAPRFIEK
jgi:hypothetical protein